MKREFIALLLGTFITAVTQANSLVVYFSWSGTTEKLAQQIVKSTGSDLFQIESAEAYPSNYQSCTEVAKEELEKEIYRKAKADLPDLASYDTIFIGVPVWWHTVPIFVQGILKNHEDDFIDKTVIPFVTYAATYRDETLSKLVELTPSAEHLTGFGTSSPSQEETDKWLKSLKVIQ